MLLDRRSLLVLVALGWGCQRPADPRPPEQGPVQGGGAPGAADVAAQLVAVLERQRDAWNRGDIVAFMAAYVHDDTLVFTSGGKVRRGYDETLERYRTRYVDAAAMGKLEFSALETTVLSEDVALVLGRWRLRETPEQGEGVFSLVFVRRGGNWQIIHDHTSVAPPPPPPR